MSPQHTQIVHSSLQGWSGTGLQGYWDTALGDKYSFCTTVTIGQLRAAMADGLNSTNLNWSPIPILQLKNTVYIRSVAAIL